MIDCVIFFEDFSNKIKFNNFPSILITKTSKPFNKSPLLLQEQLKMPFKILDFKKKIISLIAKNEFKKNSLIHLGDYIIDKNERKIKKNKGWCDDVKSKKYNREISFPLKYSAEKLYRTEIIYDIFINIKYNY